MKLLNYTLPDDHNYFSFGDVHDGSILSSQDGWNKFLNAINSKYDGCKNNYCVDGGDMIEAIMIDDKRYSPEMLKEKLPLAQLDDAVKKREPLKGKLLTILIGNHERKLWKYGDITQQVCDRLGVPSGTYTAKITVKDKKGNLMYKVFETHGFKGINSTADDEVRRRANMELVVKRHLKYKAGDCAVMIKHHAHKLVVCKPTPNLYMTDDGERIKQHYTKWGENEEYIHPDARWYGCAGSFLKLYGKDMSGYAEIFEYDPTELGFLVLRVRGKKIVGLDKYRLGI